jgi:hypothetical protein
MVAPGKPAVIPLEPECITPHDGHAKQECEQVAAKRWIARQAGRQGGTGQSRSSVMISKD